MAIRWEPATLILAAAAAAYGCHGDPGPRSRGEPQVPPPPAASGPLAGKTLALLATDGFDEDELLVARRLLAERGACTPVVSPRSGAIRGARGGVRVTIDLTLDRADAATFDGLLLPGGLDSVDALRADPRAVAFVRAFVERARVVAAVGHAPWLLVESGGVRDRTLTSWPSVKTDLLNAGAMWIDRGVAVDGAIVTSRGPEHTEALVRQATETLLAPTRPHGER